MNTSIKKRCALALSGVVLLIVALAFAYFLIKVRQTPPTTAFGSGTAPAPNPAAPDLPRDHAQRTSNNTPATASATSRLSKLFVHDVVGSTVASFETVAGPAREVSTLDASQERSYQIEGCMVSLNASGGNIIALSLDVSPNCTVPLSAMLPTEPDLNLADLTFATLFENGAQDTSLSCAGFSECGNSADPSIQTTLGGDHADNFMEVKFTGTIAGDADTSALVDMMQSEAKRLGISEEDWTKEKYNQDQQLLQMAQAKLGSVRVTSITFQSSM
jgi:hypothetical protein